MNINKLVRHPEGCTCLDYCGGPGEPLERHSPISLLTGQMTYYVRERTLKRLSQAGIKTVGDLLGVRESRLKQTKQLGIKSFREIKRILAKNGLYLGTVDSGILPIASRCQLFEWDFND